MFRIHFDPMVGRFIVQVKSGLFWRTVQTLAISNDKVEHMKFDTFDSAMDHVKAIGLNKLYRDGSRNKFDAFINSGGVHHAEA